MDTLEQRLSKSSAWLKSVGASINWLQEDVDDRVNAVSDDGNYETPILKADADDLKLQSDVKFDMNAGVLEISEGTDQLPPKQFMEAKGFVVGNKIRWASVNGNTFYTITTAINATDPTKYTCELSQPLSAGGTLSAHPEFAIFETKPSTEEPRKVTGFEIIWRPLCLSIFKHQGALPLGKYQLIATPHNASGNNYKIRAIETPHHTPTPTFGTGANDINFKVKDLRMYICNVTGPRVEDKSFFIDLEETRCQKALLKNTTNLSSEPFEIEPSSYALTYCLQDVNAGIDPKYSSSRFRERDGKELSLNRLFISLGRNNYPTPDAEPSYKEGNADDYTTKCYVDTAINCGGYFSEGGFSSLDEWQRYGAIHFFQTPRDNQDRTTRAVVNTKFAENFDNQANHVLFSHYRKAVQVTIQRGTVISVKEYVM